MSLAQGALQRAGFCGVQESRAGYWKGQGKHFHGGGKAQVAADLWEEWGSKPRGDGSEGWHWLRAISTSEEPLWGQQELLASPLLPRMFPVPECRQIPGPMRGCDGCMQ